MGIVYVISGSNSHLVSGLFVCIPFCYKHQFPPEIVVYQMPHPPTASHLKESQFTVTKTRSEQFQHLEIVATGQPFRLRHHSPLHRPSLTDSLHGASPENANTPPGKSGV